VNEGLPQCPSGFEKVSLTTKYGSVEGGGEEQTAYLFAM